MTAASRDTAVHNAGALLAVNRRRARRRRLLLWIVIPLCVLALLVPAKIASMYAFAHRSITAHVAGDFAGSTAAARGQEVANVLEAYKAPYNVGVGLAMSGDLAGAREQFERALELDPPGLEACAVHINLGITIERMGDAARGAGDPAGASALYDEALGVVADTPEECRSDEADEQSPDEDRSTGQSLDELEERLRQKQQPPPPTPTPSEDPSEPDEDRPSDAQLDELEDQLQQGDGERQQYRGDDDESGEGGVEKPW